MAPARLASGQATNVAICGGVKTTAWGQNYSTSNRPNLSDMTTYSMQTQLPQYDWVNLFTNQAKERYSTTGRKTGPTYVYAPPPPDSSDQPSYMMPSNKNLKMLAPDDANVMSMLS